MHRQESNDETMRNPCKACAEQTCMGICKDKVLYRKYLERIRREIIELNRKKHSRKNNKRII